MRPMLDDIELPQVQEIRSKERRVLAEHKPPGMEGSVLQNLGRRPLQLIVGGVVTGPEAFDFIETLNKKFRAGNPVTFTSDIVAEAEIDQLLIDDIKHQELAGKPKRVAYVLTMREYIEPVEAEDTSLLDSDILDQAQNLIDDLVDGLDLGLNFSSGLERFVAPLGEMLTRLRNFNGTT